MKKTVLTGIAVFGLALAGATGAMAKAKTEYVSYTGHWVWNATASHHAMPGTAKETLDVTDDGKTLVIHDVYSMVDGKSGTRDYNGAFDGKMRDLADMSVAYTHASANSFRDVWKVAKVAHGKEVCTFSDDGGILTCKGTETIMKKTSPYVDVWNKQ